MADQSTNIGTSKNTDADGSIVLHSYGDVELYYAAAVDSSWSLPVHVQWRHDKVNDKHYGLVLPAVALYYSQHVALIALLHVHDIQGRKDCWLIPRTMVEALLHKAPGITERAYYKWPDSECPIPIPKVLRIDKTGVVSKELITNAPNTPAQDQFTNYISEKSGIQASVIKVVFQAICDYAPKWLLEHRRALDFGFCRMIAAPFRPNWKEIVAFKYKRWKLAKLFALPQNRKMEAFEQAGLPSELCSLQNVALKRGTTNRHVQYTLEVVPFKKFEKEVAEVERSRIACGYTSYVVSFEKTVESLYSYLLDAMEGYLYKTSLPFAKLSESSSTGHIRMVPSSGVENKVRGVGLHDIPTRIIASDKPFDAIEGSGHGQPLQIPPPQVQKMPNLLQAPRDMREPTQQGGVVEQGQSGTSRLSMHDDLEGKATEQSMFPSPTLGTGDTSGVD